MIRRDLSPAEVRVLGCLIEKQRTTPDQYPLTRNAVRLACNQSTNRDPVVDYDDATLRVAVERLGRYGLVRFTSARGSRVAKYRQLAGESLGLDEPALAVLALLLLRGPQTPGELRARSERLHRFAEPGEVDDALGRLAAARLAVRFERRPGQKEARWAHLLSEEAEAGEGAEEADRLEDVREVGEPGRSAEPGPTGVAGPADEDRAVASATDPDGSGGLESRVAALERELRSLRAQLADLLED
ncbi:MAG: YceH family protein [Thermoleophilaceae bacterium]